MKKSTNSSSGEEAMGNCGSFECLVCGGKKASFGRKKNDYSIYLCCSCSHGQLHPLPTDEEITQFYQQEEDCMSNAFSFRNLEDYVKNKHATFQWYKWRVERFLSVKGTLNKNSRILDVGCATGTFLSVLRDFYGYIHLIGVDVSEHAIEKGREKLGLDLRCSSDASEKIGAHEKIDLVGVNHVLEHVCNPVDFLLKTHSRMSPGAEIMIEVPNLNGWAGQMMGRHWHWFLIPGHLHYFTKKSLHKTLSLAGFQEISIETLPVPLPAAFLGELYRVIYAVLFDKELPCLLFRPFSEMSSLFYTTIDILCKICVSPLYLYMSISDTHSVLVARAKK